MARTTATESKTEQARRTRVEAREKQLDVEERFAFDIANAGTAEERESLRSQMALQRQHYREAEVAAGRRGRGTQILSHQIMWARWLEVAVEQQLAAVESFELMRAGDTSLIADEFRASLLALTSAACVVEAPYGDVKYLVPPVPSGRRRHQALTDAFRSAFGLDEARSELLSADLQWLFELRDKAVHPYTEANRPRPHPLGFMSGAEHEDFNACTSTRAVDIAMALLNSAACATNYPNRWVERWSEARAPYRVSVVLPLQTRRHELHETTQSTLTPLSVYRGTMTISVAWERTTGKTRELVVACDSILTGGEDWEGCPKLFTFEREDCVLAFAGDTYYAYPVAVQVSAALSSFKQIRDRAKDIADVAAHVVAILNGMLEHRRGCGPPGTRFIFAGWSWRESQFKIWSISFDSVSKSFRKVRATKRQGGTFIGVWILWNDDKSS